MEVSHREDLVTHAVISTNEAQSFGMSDSAEFFNILSSTLYKNQYLAVVRETLCNAWDAHIDAGVTHLPVEVTLTNERLIIRDFGKGIPDDKMRERYCVYGSSTKTHDGKQTGGFGLGCKAPFAYADHFEVISNHAGVKSIYNMSKSNAQAGGKPGMIKLASMPTEDTGLQVSIDIKNVSDYSKFRDLVAQVAYQGDLRVKVNGHVQPTLGFDLGQANFIIVPNNTFTGSSNLHVRYGNVIYPIEHCDVLEDTKAEVVKFLKKLHKESYYIPSIVFQAPPHSISVQPSREGLSMKEHTTNTLQGLMKAFLKQVHQEFLPTCLKIRQVAILEQVKNGNMVELLDAHAHQLDTRRERSRHFRVPDDLQKIQTMNQIARRAMLVDVPNIPGYAEKDLAIRVQAMSKAGMLDRGLSSTFLRELANQVKNEEHRSDWLTRQVLAPLVLKTKEVGLLPFRLYVKGSFAYKDSVNDTLTTADYYKETRLTGVAPFLRNILVVTHKLTNLEMRMNKHPDMQDKGAVAKLLVYHCGTGKADKEKALAFFRSQPGLDVIDLTQNQLWEELNKPDRAPKKPRKEGLPALSCVIGGTHNDFNTRLMMSDDAERITSYEFVLKVSFDRDSPTSYLTSWGRTCSRLLVNLYGDRGVIVNHSGKYDTAVKGGAKDFNIFVLEQIRDTILKSKAVQKHLGMLTYRLVRGSSDDDTNKRALLAMAYRNPALQKQFKLAKPLTEHEYLMLKLWHRAQERFRNHEIVKQINKHIEAHEEHQGALQMATNLENSPLNDVLNLISLKQKMVEARPGTAQAKQLNSILQFLFNP